MAASCSTQPSPKSALWLQRVNASVVSYAIMQKQLDKVHDTIPDVSTGVAFLAISCLSS